MSRAFTLIALLAASSAAARPDTPGSDLFTFDAGDVIETFDTARFRIHFTRAGVHRVPSADVDVDNVPDHVEQIGAIYEEVLDFYTLTLGYRAPLDDGDGIFDVYLVDFGLSADGAFRQETCNGDVCAGYMVQENDFAGYPYPSANYANRLLASHEFFHAVQAAYSISQGPVFSEGTAVWASEQFDPDLDDLEAFSTAYLEETDRPLYADGTGPVDSFTYGTAIFWEYVAQTLGDDVVRALWESTEGGADVFDTMNDVFVAHEETFDGVFTHFALSLLDNPNVAIEEEEAPFEKDSFLTFTAAFRTLDIDIDDHDALEVALVGEGDDVDGLRIAMSAQGAGSAALTFGTTHAALDDLVGADRVTVQIVNTRLTGNGARPALCIGSAEEVAACIAAHTTSPPTNIQPPPVNPFEVFGCACRSTSVDASILALLVVVLPRKRPRKWTPKCCRRRGASEASV